MAENLAKEFQYYLDHQRELADQYNGRVLAIKGQAVIGVFDSELEAINETSRSHEMGTFLVQKCSPPGEGTRQTYHSRVAFR